MPIKPRALRRGTEMKGSKLNDDKVRAIRKERKEGATIHSLAVKYGVNDSTVSQLCNFVTWTHVV